MRPIQPIAALVAALASPASADPFAQLRQSYAARDPAAAAAVYAPQAVVTYRYAGVPEERHVGTAAIATSFRALFDQVDPADKLDLNFRVTTRSARQVAGFYRLRIGSTSSFGRFDVTLAPDGRFASDLSSGATLTDFEDASGPVLLAAEAEDLDREYYQRLAGRYRLADGCHVVITRSIVRLFARNSCTGAWRGLTRISGREWSAGDHVVSDKRVAIYRFDPFSSGDSPALRITVAGRTRVAARVRPYRLHTVAFTSADGTKLAGTLYAPDGPARRRPASVMIHGSGPQDRDGYASIVAVLADELAANDRMVLAYDKRGSGESSGDGDRAGFDQLASDARGAMDFLRSRPDVDPDKVGLAGSSQAGWIAARAIQRGAKPHDVLLLGAAGAALTVAEQNLYNTEVRMRCARLSASDIASALRQQRAFFDFLLDPSKAARLDRLTVRARQRPQLRDWLFPDSRATDRGAAEWYVVLDPAFDPMPIWRSYRGNSLFLFGQHDDATPTATVMARLASTRIEARKLPSAQHLGLVATGACRADLGDVAMFAPGMFEAIGKFSRPPAR